MPLSIPWQLFLFRVIIGCIVAGLSPHSIVISGAPFVAPVAGFMLVPGSALIALTFQLFVYLYEEPSRARRLGAGYDVYRAQVPRWLPRAVKVW